MKYSYYISSLSVNDIGSEELDLIGMLVSIFQGDFTNINSKGKGEDKFELEIKKDFDDMFEEM